MARPRHGRVERHGERWRFQIYVHGERIRRSFDTREQAEQALLRFRQELDDNAVENLVRRLGRVTVADVVGAYYERRRNHLEDSTKARYENVMHKYILPGIGHLDARDVAASALLLEDWLATVPWGSARKALEVLGPALRMAYDNGVIPADPVAKIRRPKRPDRRRKKAIPTPSEVEKIIAAYEQDIWLGYFVELTATLGLRRAETCALRWEDFEFPKPRAPHGRVHIRRAVGKRSGGVYIKAPKSGQPREVVVHRSLFEGLDAFRDAEGWLFPGRAVRPRRNPDELTIDSTPGRLLVYLLDQGGVVECPSGTAGARARRAIGTNSATLSCAVSTLLERRLIERDANARRTFRLALTSSGRGVATALSEAGPAYDMPVHPDTMGHRFADMIERLGLHSASGERFTLHSLRHYRATHLYNSSKDWVQVARYLGHTSPAITMDLYANNVVQPTQELLADAAVRFED